MLTVNRLHFVALSYTVSQLDLEQGDEPAGELLFCLECYGEALILSVQSNHKLVLAVISPVDVETCLDNN